MTLFALSCIFTALFTAILCIVILLNNFKNRVNQSWFLTCLSIFTWTIGLYGVTVSQNENYALFWQRVLYIGTILIPIFFFYFCLSFLNRKGTKLLFTGIFLSIIFIFLVFNKLFIVGVDERTSFGYWPVKVGYLYYLFLFYFLFYTIYSVALLKIDTKKHSGNYQKQIQYIYYAALIGFIGGSTNFLLDFNLGMYHFGNYFVILYVIFITYAILKHQLFNLRVIATELLTFSIWITLFIRTLLSQTIQDLIVNIILLIVMIFFGILLIRSVLKEVRQREKMEQMAKELEKAYEVEKEAKKKIEELNKAKTRFMSITSHQLRAPLTVIKGYISMILEGTYGKMNGKIKEKLERAFQSNERLVKLVSDLLNVSRIEEGRIEMKFAKLNLEDLISNLVKELSIKTQEKGIYLKFEKPKEKLPEISADKDKISEVILNILDNAIKYTPKGEVTIKIQKLKSLFTEEVDKIKIIISDTGEGMTPEEIDNLFKSFSRGEAGTFSYPEGMGLGLYIAKLFVELHRGKIWAESEGKGKGSTFYIELPIK